jgi:hypothetical protein
MLLFILAESRDFMPDLTPEEIATTQQRLRDEIAEIEERSKTDIAVRKELIRAYSLVLQHQQTNGQAGEIPVTARHRTRIFAEPGYGYNTEVVRQAIRYLNQPFTIRQVWEALVAHHINLPIEAVTTVVNRLRMGEPPEIRVREQGIGRRASVFESAT